MPKSLGTFLESPLERCGMEVFRVQFTHVDKHLCFVWSPEAHLGKIKF